MRVYLGLANYCNLNCIYCYRRVNEKSCQANKQLLDIRLIEKLISILQTAHDINRFDFALHGHEPLVVGIEYMKDIFSLIDKANLDYSINVQTNLTLINYDLINLFKQQNVTIGISIDGPEFIHDTVRVFHSGKGTLRTVMDGVQLLRVHGINPAVICVVTRSSLGNEEYIYNFFKENLLNFTISPVVLCVKGDNSSNYLLEPEEYATFFIKMFDLYISDKDRANRIFCMDSFIRKFLFPVEIDKGKFCYDNIMFMDYDGSLYRCGRFAGLKDFSIGNVLDYNSFEEVLSINATGYFEESIRRFVSRCKDCDLFQFCGAGCFYVGLANCSLPGDSFSCDYSKAIIPHMVERVYQKMCWKKC